MADTDISQKGLDALLLLNTAIKNVRLYPPTSAAIISTIEKLHQTLGEMLDQKNPIVFAELEKNILICDTPLTQKDQEKNHVVALLNTLLGFDLKSISFGQGLEKEELSAFSEILSRKPDAIKSEGGLPMVFGENNITHIFLDQKLYVAMDNDKKEISSLDSSDDIKYTEIQKPGEGNATEGLYNAGTGQTKDDGQEKIDYKTKLIEVSERLSLSLKENENTLLDEPLMSVIPRIIEQLITEKEHETMEEIIDHLADNLLSENDEVRAHAAKALVNIIESLPPNHKAELIEKLSGQLIAWIKIETWLTEAYQTICNYLQNIVQEFIYQQRYAESIPIVDIFGDINSGILAKNDAVHEVCTQLIHNLATEENIALLFKEYNTNEHNNKDEAGKILLRFDDIILKSMLDNLQDSTDSDERVRIMHLIIGIGQKSIPLLRERIHKDAPWYYLRNIAYVLGQIGNEESAGSLQPLLSHENDKLKHEALKSITKTGGNRRGKLLTSALPGADEKFKPSIIKALGNAKAADSVPDLLKILTTPPLVITATRSLLEEVICTALGAIGSPEAIPVLSEIAETKSFLRIRPYPDKLRAAAARALESIRKKQVDAMPKLNITR